MPSSTAFARKAAEKTARISRLEAKKANAPRSTLKIPTRGLDFGSASVAIRQVGCTRRVFLRKPYLSGEEAEGLAYRLKVLSKNEAINSVLIAPHHEDDEVLPESCRDVEQKQLDLADYGFASLNIGHVAGGYDPIKVYTSGLYKDATAVNALLTSMEQLTLATRGDPVQTRIPVITMPDGLVNDGGYALCMGSYVLATRDSRFCITHPSKGLALDPIGLSYMLPRLGWEHELPSADYPGVGTILALTGMEANASDMMETGLATNYVETPTILGTLERTLSEIVPWNQQDIVKPKPRLMGQDPPKQDVNAEFRNRALANSLDAFTVYHASNRDMWSNKDGGFEGFESLAGEDPSLELDPTPWEADRTSDLVNYAATFADIFERESSVVGLLESFREVAAQQTTDQEELEGIQVAADFAARMERQSPLSLHVVYKLLKMGGQDGETLESCMGREKRVQAKLFGMADYQNWAKHASKNDSRFTGWSHKSVQDVTNDQVEELLGDDTAAH